MSASVSVCVCVDLLAEKIRGKHGVDRGDEQQEQKGVEHLKESLVTNR